MSKFNFGESMGAIHRDEGLERVIQQALDDGRSVWVVGDIHGHLKTFKDLLDILWHPLQSRDHDALQDDHVEWAQGMLEHYEPGAIHDMPDYGITLQIISSDTARCIGVFDHGFCMLMLQMVITTFENAGLNLEVDPWAVLRPYEAPEEAAESSVEAPQNSTGQEFAMEVV